MQPTVSPWSWGTWQRRARARAAQYEHARSLHLDPYAFYGFRKDPLTGQHIKSDPYSKLIDDQLFGERRQAPTAPPRPLWWDDVYRRHPWLTDLNLPPDKVTHIRIDPGFILSHAGGADGAGVSGVTRGSHVPAWAHAARGWAAAGAIVLLLILLVRAAENCLQKRLFKTFYMHNVGGGQLQRDSNDSLRGRYVCNHNDEEVRRHDSEEWSRPSVTATSQAQELEVSSLAHLESGNVGVTSLPGDLPPPYWQCDVTKRDEPPPPYSACAPPPHPPHPTVHYSGERVTIDNFTNDLIENRHTTRDTNNTPSGQHDNNTEPSTTRELVFNNGRVVERDDSNRIEVHDNNDAEARTRSAGRPGEAKDDNVTSTEQNVVV